MVLAMSFANCSCILVAGQRLLVFLGSPLPIGAMTRRTALAVDLLAGEIGRGTGADECGNADTGCGERTNATRWIQIHERRRSEANRPAGEQVGRVGTIYYQFGRNIVRSQVNGSKARRPARRELLTDGVRKLVFATHPSLSSVDQMLIEPLGTSDAEWRRDLPRTRPLERFRYLPLPST